MIGIDLAYKGVPIPTLEKYLGTPADLWVGLSLGEIYERLRKRGWDVTTDVPVDRLVLLMQSDGLLQIPGWTAPTDELVHEAPPIADAPEQEFKCARKGHTWRAHGVYRWETATTPKVQSEPLCPFCFIDFANTLFALNAVP